MREFCLRSVSLMTPCAALISVCLLVSNSGSCFAQETNETVRGSVYDDRRAPKVIEREAPSAKVKTYTTRQLEENIVNQINSDREKNGQGQLKVSKELGDLARELAEDLMKHDRFEHKTSKGLATNERALARGIKCFVFENLGEQGGPDSALQMVREIQESFMNEPKNETNHRFILLHPTLVYVGVGIAQKKDKVVMVQNFTQEEPLAK